MKEMIDYFKLMITPPIEDPIVLVGKPSEIDYDSFMALEGASILPIHNPSVHGIILLEEPTEEEAKLISSILLPGAHVILIPEDIGYNGVIALEDRGLEVRDAIFVADGDNDFYYCSKARRSEREAGLDSFEEKEGHGGMTATKNKDMKTGSGNERNNIRKNIHPTVKPIEVMEWCARDIAPNSKVVDPFLGSGTTGIAMSRLHHDFVGIELNPEYAKICEARIRHWMPIGTEIESEAQVGKAESTKGEQISIFDIFGD
jgi:hypothetical protein